ncbi:uncharacterized protein MONBRDRAFT_23279 [Monosiga brevicollis MX1]|uniref:RING-type domain-containing protein n=1 Tax=Monosiga brevicollis TaxID=81824 RepID=A9USX9_MONBE|nr:uncharacterized protein MONBRDRAFT_23279 [Monosiga brevicollis MX1]EDQ91146.1 predicted protein [Monosiga brevicollis MX1]|eukprot:XP_001743568.1 hypothetical protein [Monosiga brevicollis MX1]
MWASLVRLSEALVRILTRALAWFRRSLKWLRVIAFTAIGIAFATMTLRTAWNTNLVCVAYALATYACATIAGIMVATARRSPALMRVFEHHYEHLDLGLLDVTLRIWHLVLRWLASFVTRAYNGLRRLVQWDNLVAILTQASHLTLRVVRPALSTITAMIMRIWHSPLLPLMASILLIYGIYLHHEGKFDAPLATSYHMMGLLGARVNAAAIWCSTSVSTVMWVVWGGVQAVVGAVNRFILDLSHLDFYVSPTFAMSFYVVNVLLGRFQLHRILPFKTILVPALILGSGLWLTPRHIWIYFVVAIFWAGISAGVWLAEAERRRRAGERLQRMQRMQTTRRGAEIVEMIASQKPDQVYEADMCIICFAEFDDASSELKAVLPCGHQTFHRSCLAEWLDACGHDKRCPVCREPVETSLLHYAF